MSLEHEFHKLIRQIHKPVCRQVGLDAVKYTKIALKGDLLQNN